MAKKKWKADISVRSFLYSLLAGITLGYTVGYISLNIIHSSNQPNSVFSMISRFRPEEAVGFGNNSLNNTYVEQSEVPGENVEDHEGAKRVRVLCWVMTSPSNHYTKAIHVKNTWGRRCDILLFMSSSDDLNLPAIGLPVKEGRDHLWSKTKEAFKYIYKHYFSEADWFLKADDDTYVIIENLKYLLADHNSSESKYFGWRFKQLVKQGFMSGGAGYVLSKAALKKFILEALPNTTFCGAGNDGFEDVELGTCLENVGVPALDSRDSFGRERFFPNVPKKNLIPGHSLPDFYGFIYSYHFQREGVECCSDSAISFHYVTPNIMYTIDEFIYKVRPHGIDRRVY